MARAGSMHALVNDAGVGWAGRFEDMPVEEIERIGSAFNYEAGFGPVRFRGHTVVRDCDGGSRLEMEADANLLSARVAIGIKPWGDHSLVVVEEHWIRGPYLLLDNPLIDLALNIRNRLMVRRLAEVVQGRSLPNHGCR